jgi:hypothetical protein
MSNEAQGVAGGLGIKQTREELNGISMVPMEMKATQMETKGVHSELLIASKSVTIICLFAETQRKA